MCYYVPIKANPSILSSLIPTGPSEGKIKHIWVVNDYIFTNCGHQLTKINVLFLISA